MRKQCYVCGGVGTGGVLEPIHADAGGGHARLHRVGDHHHLVLRGHGVVDGVLLRAGVVHVVVQVVALLLQQQQAAACSSTTLLSSQFSAARRPALGHPGCTGAPRSARVSLTIMLGNQRMLSFMDIL